MLVTGFASGAFQANCYLAAAGPRSEAVVIDPGQDPLGPIQELSERHHLRPAPAPPPPGPPDPTAPRAPPCSPTATSTTSGRRRPWPAPAASPRGSTRATGTC